MIGLAALALVVAARPCSPPANWSALRQRPERFIIVGELHGTRETSEAVGEIVCALSLRDPILVAVELASRDDAALQEAWHGPEAGFPERLRLALPEWTRRPGGGPASDALFAMLLRLHALRAAGARVDVVAFTGPRDQAQRERFGGLTGQNQYEAMQAENIDLAADAGPYRRVLVLVGNLHARKQPAQIGPVKVEPMASRLAPAREVLSLNLAYSSGSAFNCLAKPDAPRGVPPAPDMLDCSPHPVLGNTALTGNTRLVTETSAMSDAAYNGVLFVGPITASGPVQ